MNDQIEVACAQLPKWLPILVREHFPTALRQYLAAGEDPAPDMRLATDLRMRGVWGNLKKRHRTGSKKYFYTLASNIAGIEGWPRQEEARIERAMAMLFGYAIVWFRQPVGTLSRSEIKDLVDHFKNLAKTRREIDEELNQYSTDNGRCLSLGKKNIDAYYLMEPISRIMSCSSSGNILNGLFTASLFCENLANIYDKYLIPKAVVDRRRMDPRLRAFLVMLTRKTKHIFGLPLYGVVATIASVLFEQTVSKSSVRECVANDENLST